MSQYPTPEPEKQPKMRKSQTITLWLVLMLLFLIVYQFFFLGKSKTQEIAYSQFMQMVRAGKVQEALFNDKDVNFTASKLTYHTYLPFPSPTLVDTLVAHGVTVVSQKPSKWGFYALNWLPMILLFVFFIFLMRSLQGGGNKAFSFGKSRARLFMGGKTNKTFADVAGVEEAKEELEEIVDFLKSPTRFQRLGGRIPRGVLLLGPPGTGKTLLAKAVAGEAGVPFYSISGSDFVEMFVGVGASRVRDLFEQAKRTAPCIAFIDEIDAVGRHRGSGLGGGHDEREQTLNQLLVEMDGFEANDSVIIIAATNRPDVLDPALLRPGRFDRQVVVDLPDVKGRTAILQVHSKNLPMAGDVSMSVIARGTPGFSGADLENLVNEAALLAARRNKQSIEMADIEEAKDKVTLGKERKSKVISEEEKRNTSFHEVGHVLCAAFQDKTEPIHKVSIIPRGFSLGALHYLQSDRVSTSRSILEQQLVVMMGGRAAEELVFGELTTGAGNDIERATDIAKKMVCTWGMSEEIGPMTIGKEDGQVFLGKELSQHEMHSEETARIVDAEIRSIIHHAHDSARKILGERRGILDAMAEKLLEHETLNVDDIYGMILEMVSDDEKDAIRKRYNRALEMRIDSDTDTKKTDVATASQSAPIEDESQFESAPESNSPSDEVPPDDQHA